MFSQLFAGGSGKKIYFGVLQKEVNAADIPDEEERAARRCGALRVLNSYWLNEVRAFSFFFNYLFRLLPLVSLFNLPMSRPNFDDVKDSRRHADLSNELVVFIFFLCDVCQRARIKSGRLCPLSVLHCLTTHEL